MKILFATIPFDGHRNPLTGVAMIKIEKSIIINRLIGEVSKSISKERIA
jgi:hypothetical protein